MRTLLRWTTLAPVLALVVLAFTWERDLPALVAVVVAAFLIAAVLAAVHHAEVVAHRVGEPFGSLVLALAVTIIEVALIVTLTVSGGGKNATLARDTIFAAVMITTNGIVGICLLVGALRHRVVAFSAAGSGGAFATVTALATLTLILPTFTTSTGAGTFSPPQLAFAAVMSVALYGVYLFVQTIRHRDYFLPVGVAEHDEQAHADPPSNRTAYVSLALLGVALVGVVGLAKTESPTIERGVQAIGAPASVVGITIALLVLLPETIAAVRAAAKDRVQTSLNLGLGSALASIGLTIPAMAVATIFISGPLVLGLAPTEMVLFALTVAISIFTLVGGRATVLQGSIHLLVFASFVFIALRP